MHYIILSTILIIKMDVKKITRETKEYTLPTYTTAKRHSVPENMYSEYYLNNLNLPKECLNQNLVKKDDRKLPLLSLKDSADAQLHSLNSLLEPMNSPRMKSLAPNSPRIIQYKTPKRGRKELKAFYYVHDFGKVRDLRDIFKKVSPDKFKRNSSENVVSSAKITKEQIPKKPIITKYGSVRDLLNTQGVNQTPISILKKFEEMVSINMQHIKKLISGNRAEQKQVLEMKEGDMRIDLCELNSKVKLGYDFMKGEVGYKAKQQQQHVSPFQLMKKFKEDSEKPNAIFGRNANTTTRSEHKVWSTRNEVVRPFLNFSDTSCKVNEKPLSPSIKTGRKTQQKQRLTKAYKTAPAEVRELLRNIDERKSSIERIRRICKKFDSDLRARECTKNDTINVANSMKSENPISKAALAKVFQESMNQLNDPKFNIKKRYFIDSAALEKYRRHLYKDYKLAEKRIMGIEGDRFKSKHNMVKNDRYISKLLYSKRRSSG